MYISLCKILVNYSICCSFTDCYRGKAAHWVKWRQLCWK